MISNWFRQWHGAVGQKAITWVNFYPDLCRHFASLDIKRRVNGTYINIFGQVVLKNVTFWDTLVVKMYWKVLQGVKSWLSHWQRPSNMESVSLSWRHRAIPLLLTTSPWVTPLKKSTIIRVHHFDIGTPLNIRDIGWLTAVQAKPLPVN